MKKRCFPVLLSFCVWFAGILSANAITIDLIPNSSALSVGESLDIDLVIYDLSADDLSTFDLNVVYDPGLLSFTGYSLGTQLGDLAVGDAVDFSIGDTGGGNINLAELSWLMDLSFQPNFFSLASLSFSAVSPGSLSVSLAAGSILGDYYGDPLILENSSVIGLEITEPVNSPVPLPAPFLLLGTGLAGLGIFRMRSGCEGEVARE